MCARTCASAGTIPAGGGQEEGGGGEEGEEDGGGGSHPVCGGEIGRIAGDIPRQVHISPGLEGGSGNEVWLLGGPLLVQSLLFTHS